MGHYNRLIATVTTFDVIGCSTVTKASSQSNLRTQEYVIDDVRTERQWFDSKKSHLPVLQRCIDVYSVTYLLFIQPLSIPIASKWIDDDGSIRARFCLS